MKILTETHYMTRVLLILAITLGLSACGSSSDDNDTPDPPPVATNNAPAIGSTAVTAAEEGQVYTYTLTASDADGDTITLAATSIPAWLSFTASTGVLTGTPATGDVGNVAVTLTASDGTATATQTFTIVVAAAPVVNAAPAITSTAVTTATEAVAYTYTFTASDADGDTLTLSGTTVPAWLTFDASTGVLSGTPASANIGANAVVLAVSDGTESVEQSFSITVDAAPMINTPPVITSSALTMGTVDVSYSYTITATDADADTLSFSSTTLPAWGTFDDNTGVLSGVPDVAGDYLVELLVSDGTDSVTQNFTISVTEASSNVALSIFENAAIENWVPWACCGSDGPTIVTDDAEHDQAVEIALSANAVAGFSARASENAVNPVPFDMSTISAAGTLQFELKLMANPTNGATNTWLLKVETSSDTVFVEVPLSSAQEGHAGPVLDTWQTYTFNVDDLISSGSAGFDGSDIVLIMVFPDFANSNGAVYRLDNVKFLEDGNDSGSNEPPPEAQTTTVFADTFLADWTSWACCSSAGPTLVNDGAERGDVVEVGLTENAVAGFSTRNSETMGTPAPLDLRGFAQAGTLSFDLKLVTNPTAGATNVWKLKVETSLATRFVEVDLSSAQEGHAAPALDTWQTYTFNIADLISSGAGGFDGSDVVLFMMFPDFGVSNGAVYRLDNLVLSTQGATDDGNGDGNNNPPGDSMSGGTLVVDVTQGIDFEGTEAQQTSWNTFENGSNPPLEFVTNPDPVGNTTAQVAKFTLQAADPNTGKFAGAVTRTVQNFQLSDATKIARIWVWKDKISPVGIKFERFRGPGPNDYGSHGELTVSNTKINEWEQLTIDFTAQLGLPENDDISGIAIFPDMVDGRAATVIYVDEITFSSN